MEISDTRQHYDAELGSLKAEVHAIHKRLDSIAEDIRSSKAAPKGHVYAVLVAIVTGLVTIGTFALTPVTQNVAEVKARLAAIEGHDNDGHPEAVINMIRSLDQVHTRERQVNSASILRFEDRLDEAERVLSILNTIAEERTERFHRALDLRDEKIELRSGDRWTGSEQRVYAKSVDLRLKALEKMLRQNSE